VETGEFHSRSDSICALDENMISEPDPFWNLAYSYLKLPLSASISALKH